MQIAEIASLDVVLIVIAVGLIVFGSAKLPKIARGLGSAKSEFEKGVKEGQATQRRRRRGQDRQARQPEPPRSARRGRHPRRRPTASGAARSRPPSCTPFGHIGRPRRGRRRHRVPARASRTPPRVATDDGLFMVDTGSSVVAPLLHEEIRALVAGPARHRGLQPRPHRPRLRRRASSRRRRRRRAGAPPRVVAHEHLPARFDRYRRTAGFNQIINRRQFGFKDLVWPTEYRYPDETYATERTPRRRRAPRSTCATRRARPTTTP